MDDPRDIERERRAAAELKKTEDLLAGFDRPGRTPRIAPVRRDFVDYHLEKRRSNPDVVTLDAERARRALPTALVPSKRRFPRWLPWVSVVAFVTFVGTGIVVVLLLTPQRPPEQGASGAMEATAELSVFQRPAATALPLETDHGPAPTDAQPLGISAPLESPTSITAATNPSSERTLAESATRPHPVRTGSTTTAARPANAGAKPASSPQPSPSSRPTSSTSSSAPVPKTRTPDVDLIRNM